MLPSAGDREGHWSSYVQGGPGICKDGDWDEELKVQVPFWPEGGHRKAEDTGHECVQEGLAREKSSWSPGILHILIRLPKLPSPLTGRGRTPN